MNRLDQIKYVVDSSDDVVINYDKLIEYTNSLKDFENIYWLNKYKDSFTEKELILLVFIMQSMDFCFWGEPYLVKEFEGKVYKRVSALFYAVLDEALNNHRFLDIDNLMNLKKEDLLRILGVDSNQPFIDNRYNNLMETVTIIKNNANFYQELFKIKDMNELLEYIVNNFPSFKDVSIYKGKEIMFYKRASLLVNDLYELSPIIKNNIKSVDELLGCADYGIPKTLRHYGVLEYSKELASIVDNKKLIPHNSNYEIEIRANMLYALELIKEELLKRNININSINLDHIIWFSGRGINEPHHLTETIYY